MAADWGLYSALRGTDDWQTKRQDKQMNLLAAEKRGAVQQQKVAQSAAAEADIAKYMEELQNLEVLPEDQERVAQAEKEARQKIVAGIAKSNGDLRRYMSSGGTTALSEYKTSIMQSGAVKQAGVNKVNLQNYLTQDAKGNQRHRMVDVTIPMMGEGGEPMLDNNGQQITETKKMSFQDQYNLYKQGKIQQINYDGSEKRVNLGIEDFNRMYKNPSDPYQKDNYVSESNIYQKMLSKGSSEEYAREQAKKYGEMYKQGGDAWRWNSKDPYELQMKVAKLNAAKAAAIIKEKARGTSTRLSHAIPTAIMNLPPGKEHQMAPKEIDWWKDSFQFDTNDEKGLHSPNQLMVKDAHNLDFEYDLSKARNINFNKIVAKQGPEGTVNKYIEADVVYDDPTSLMGGIISFGGDYGDLPFDDVFGYTSPKDKSIEKNWQMDPDNNYFNGTVLIPLDKKMASATFQTQMDKYIGTNINADFTAPSITNEDQQAQAAVDYQYLISLGFKGVELDQALIDLQSGIFDDL